MSDYETSYHQWIHCLTFWIISVTKYCVGPTWVENFQFWQGLLSLSSCSHRLWDPVTLYRAGTLGSVPEVEVARARSWPCLSTIDMHSPLSLRTKESVHFLGSDHVLHTGKPCVITWQLLTFIIRQNEIVIFFSGCLRLAVFDLRHTGVKEYWRLVPW